MGIEDANNMEGQQPIEISEQEYNDYCRDSDMEDPEFLKWIAEKGIELGSGDVEVVYRGVRYMMATSEKDF